MHRKLNKFWKLGKYLRDINILVGTEGFSRYLVISFMIFTNLRFLHTNYNLRTLFVFRKVSLIFKANISGHIRPTDCPLSAPAVNLLILYTAKFLTSVILRDQVICVFEEVSGLKGV